MPKAKQKTQLELLLIAITAKRVNDDTFMVPSDSDKSKMWYVDIKLKTCRDQNGNGCPFLYYYHECKHRQAVEMILKLLENWS